MKYAIVILDGAADRPLAELGGLTPLAAADAPALARLAGIGRQGVVRTTPEGLAAGSDLCCMTLFGYDPRRYHTGRAPLEAAAMGLSLRPTDTIFRLNLVTTGESDADRGLMLDHSAGQISDAEARVLLRDLMEHWRRALPDLTKSLSLTHGVSYRSILIDSSARAYLDSHAGDSALLSTTPPHDIPSQPWSKHLPRGSGADAITTLMLESRKVFAEHEVNRARRAAGLRPATMAWIWGQGSPTTMPPFKERFGLRGAITTAVDLLAGLAHCMGWDRLPVPGATSYHHDNDYAAQGSAAAAALDAYDLVVAHVETPDEASHQGDWRSKVAAIEAIDRHVIAPILTKLESFGLGEDDPRASHPASAAGWRILLAPDHYTLVSTRQHDATPPPFLIAGSWIRSVVKSQWNEKNATDSDLQIDPGAGLMEYFLFSGLKRPALTRNHAD